MGRNPFRLYIPAQNAPVTWPHLIEQRRGRVGKARRIRRSKQAEIEWQEASTSLGKSLRIHENEVAHGHAKLSVNQKHQFEFVNSEGGMPKIEGAKRATSRTSGIN